MADSAAPLVQKSFPLDAAILGPDSAFALQVGANTDLDVIQALLANQPFPTRPGGVIDLANISLTATGGKSVVFDGAGRRSASPFLRELRLGWGFMTIQMLLLLR